MRGCATLALGLLGLVLVPMVLVLAWDVGFLVFLALLVFALVYGAWHVLALLLKWGVFSVRL